MKKKMFVGLVVIFLSLTGFTLESSSELVTVSGFCRSAVVRRFQVLTFLCRTYRPEMFIQPPAIIWAFTLRR